MANPIIEFKTQERAVKSLKEWQHRLYLDDWILRITLEYPQNMNGFRGLSTIQTECKCALIQLAIPNQDLYERIIKFCQEQTLVHELLHLKYSWDGTSDTYEGRYVDACEHSVLEQMARSLIMAKYKIGPEWFDNI